MNRTLLGVLSIGMCIVMVGVVLAQNPPPPQPEGGPGQGPGPGGFGQGGFTQPVQQPGEFNPRGGQGGQGGFGRGGRGGGGGGGGRGGEFNDRARGDRGPIQGPDVNKFEMLRGYIEVVDRYATMTRSADSAGVAAVISASDILRQRGPEAAADYLTRLLPEVKIPAIERAIRIQLSDLYRQSGQGDKALEHLTVLMKAGN